MEPKCPEGGHCHSVLRTHGVYNVPFIFNNSVETAVPFNVVNHPRSSETINQSLKTNTSIDRVMTITEQTLKGIT